MFFFFWFLESIDTQGVSGGCFFFFLYLFSLLFLHKGVLLTSPSFFFFFLQKGVSFPLLSFFLYIFLGDGWEYK